MPLDRTSTYWFPMRVACHRELRVRDELQRLSIEHYLPLKWSQRTYGGQLRSVQVPAINYIFVHSSQQSITDLKMYNKELAYMRYKMNACHDGSIPAEIMTVSDREMNNFMLVTRNGDEQLEYLTYTDFFEKEGRKVQIIDGVFAGVEGEIKRIKKDRCVVVTIKGIAAVAMQVPFSHLKFI